MTSKLYLAAILLLLGLQTTYAQSISNSLFSAVGSSTAQGEIYLSWSMGEAVTDILRSDNNLVIQGFHQPFTSGSTSVFAPQIGFGIKVFPNPTQHFLVIKNEQFEHLKLFIFNATGQLVLKDQFQEEVIINVHHWQPGTYYLQLKSNDLVDQSTIFQKL